MTTPKPDDGRGGAYLPPDNSVPVDDVLAMIRDPRWTWVRNNRCKYVSIQIDTRSMRCHIKDRDGNAITFRDLSRQCDEYLHLNKPPTPDHE